MEIRTVRGLGIREPPKIPNFLGAQTPLINTRKTKSKKQIILLMIVKITAHWGATPFYDAGERQFEMEWGNNIIPLVGNSIRLFSFMDTSCEDTEVFLYEERQINVFQFIEEEHHWIVKKVEWERKGKDLIGHVLVTDCGYFTK